MINIPYSDSRLSFLGRWTDFGTKKGSYWQGSQIRFTVSGTATVKLNCDIVDANSSDLAFAAVSVDKGASEFITLSTAGETFSGTRTATVTLPDTGVHSLIVKLGGFPNQQWDGSTICHLISVDIDDGSTLSATPDTSSWTVGFIGDSWMGTTEDWPYLLPELSAVPQPPR